MKRFFSKFKKKKKESLRFRLIREQTLGTEPITDPELLEAIEEKKWEIKKMRGDQILIVLDLDETLIHASRNPKFENWAFEYEEYKVFKRPGLTEFLIKLTNYFEVAVWSSASDDYVAYIVDKIFPKNYDLKFAWGRSKCTPRIDTNAVEEDGYVDYDKHLVYCKMLRKVHKKKIKRIEKILIIDNTPQKVKYNYGNAIYPSEFYGNPYDRELDDLFKYLLNLREAKNVRTIEKRGWKLMI